MPNHNCYKSDVFTLGMIFLSLANLENLYESVNWLKYCYNYSILE